MCEGTQEDIEAGNKRDHGRDRGQAETRDDGTNRKQHKEGKAEK